MKKIIGIVIALSVILFSTNTFAQDPKAKVILEAVSKKMASMKSMKSNFSFKMKNAQGKNLGTKQGSIILSGNKYRIKLGEQEMITDGNSMWTYIKSSNEVQISKYSASGTQISPAKLFSGSYEKEYTYKYLGDKTINGINCSQIELIPKTKSSFAKMILFINKSNNEIAGGDLYEKGGNVISLTLSGLTINPSGVSPSSFQFDTKQYPGVEVIDLR